MFKKEITRILSESEVFRGLTDDDLKIVSKHCQKVTFQEKDLLITRRTSGVSILYCDQGAA